MDHPTWIDDERNMSLSTSCCEIYTDSQINGNQPHVQRPLWQDILWGQEAWHDPCFDNWDDDGLADTRVEYEDCDNDGRKEAYVDYEFDSGCGSDSE